MGSSTSFSNPSNPISQIANTVTNVSSNVGNAIDKGTGSNIGNTVSGGYNKLVDTALTPMNVVGNIALGTQDPSQPSAPGVDSGLSGTLTAQQQNAQQFRANMPQNEQAAYGTLAVGANNQLTKNLTAQNYADNPRGLLYGGVNQGHQQQQRANTSTELAAGRENINDQYQNAANQMDAAAVNTGQMVQQSQQSVQNQIYNQAFTNMMNQNNAFGSLAGAAGTVGAFAVLHGAVLA